MTSSRVPSAETRILYNHEANCEKIQEQDHSLLLHKFHRMHKWRGHIIHFISLSRRLVWISRWLSHRFNFWPLLQAPDQALTRLGNQRFRHKQKIVLGRIEYITVRILRNRRGRLGLGFVEVYGYSRVRERTTWMVARILFFGITRCAHPES